MNDATSVFVRPALVTHGATIAKIQAQSMADVLESEFPGEGLAKVINEQAMASSWSKTLTVPPSSGQGVYVATEVDTPVGFVAITPAVAESGEPGTATEILALDVAEGSRGSGHGSRMLAAVADLARGAGSVHLQVWLAAGEEDKIRFFQSAGFAPAGTRRTLDVAGHPLTQHLWFAKFD